MKQIALAVVMVLAIGACSKKQASSLPTPGGKPNKDPNAQIQPAVKPPIVPIDANSEILGNFETDCVKEMYRTNPQPHVTQLYESYKIYLSIEKDKMTTNFIRFVGETCGSLDFAIEILPVNQWTYVANVLGSIDSKPWEITYTSHNKTPMSFADKLSVGRVFEGEDYYDVVSFESEEEDGISYRRSK